MFVKHQGAILETVIVAVPDDVEAGAREARTADRNRRNERNVQLQWTQMLIVWMDGGCSDVQESIPLFKTG